MCIRDSYDLVAVVVLDALVLLPVAGDSTQQQVGECVARGNTRAGIEGQITGDRTRSQFGAELKIVPADNLAHIVPVGVSRVRVISAIGDIPCILSKAAVVGISDQVD